MAYFAMVVDCARAGSCHEQHHNQAHITDGEIDSTQDGKFNAEKGQKDWAHTVIGRGSAALIQSAGGALCERQRDERFHARWRMETGCERFAKVGWIRNSNYRFILSYSSLAPTIVILGPNVMTYLRRASQRCVSARMSI